MQANGGHPLPHAATVPGSMEPGCQTALMSVVGDRLLPEPLTPSECDISDWPGMMLDVPRLMKSRAWLICKRRPELAFYMLNLWMAAWHEVPAASLENDDEWLADKAKCDYDLWLSMREDVLRGFVLCSDGRLYHEVIAIKALEVWLDKLSRRITSGHGNAEKWKGSFDDSPLRTQVERSREMLRVLDPMSKVFTRKRAGVDAKPKQAPSDAGIQAGSGPEQDGIARVVKGRVGKEVGGKPPTTPSAGAPGVHEEAPAMPPAPEPVEPPVVTAAPTPAPTAAPASAAPAKPTLKTKIELADRSLELPDWLRPFEEQFKAFEEVRWAMHSKAPYTARAQAGIVKKLAELRDLGHDPGEVLAASARNGWRDVFPTKSTVLSRSGGQGSGKWAAASAGVFTDLHAQEVQ